MMDRLAAASCVSTEGESVWASAVQACTDTKSPTNMAKSALDTLLGDLDIDTQVIAATGNYSTENGPAPIGYAAEIKSLG